MQKIHVKAYAKINPALDVKGLLDNGYHRLDMIMHMTDLHDDVEIGWEPGGASLEIKLDPGRYDLPSDEHNIAYKAAALMGEKFCRCGKLYIDITKRIPVAAGLAGGSGNSAAVICGLNVLWNLGLDLTQLMDIGKLTGSDVPFSIAGIAKMNNLAEGGFTCARAVYDGTVLEKLPPLTGVYAVLSKPDISVSTAEVYRGIDEIVIPKHPDMDSIIRAIKGKDVEVLKENMLNVLENYTLNRYNYIKETKRMFEESDTDIYPVMSGSGPTVFALLKEKDKAFMLSENLEKYNRETYLTALV